MLQGARVLVEVRFCHSQFAGSQTQIFRICAATNRERAMLRLAEWREPDSTLSVDSPWQTSMEKALDWRSGAMNTLESSKAYTRRTFSSFHGRTPPMQRV